MLKGHSTSDIYSLASTSNAAHETPVLHPRLKVDCSVEHSDGNVGN